MFVSTTNAGRPSPESAVLDLYEILLEASDLVLDWRKRFFEIEVVDKSWLESHYYDPMYFEAAQGHETESIMGDQNEISPETKDKKWRIDGVLEVGFIRKGDENGDNLDKSEVFLVKARLLLGEESKETININYY